MADLDRRGYSGFLLFLFLAVFSVGYATADPEESRELLDRAGSLYRSGDSKGALTALRSLRSRFPDSPEAEQALGLSIQISLSTGDQYLARFFFNVLITEKPASPAVYSSAVMIADYLYSANSRSTAIQYYTIASEHPAANRNSTEFSRLMVRLADLTLYEAFDAEAARYYFQKSAPEKLGRADVSLYKELSKRLSWERLSTRDLGLSDENISFLRADGDDLWVGTWNGGVARYSLSSGEIAAFPFPPSMSRSIEVAPRRIWVGTAEGLDWFSKPSSRWQIADELHSPDALNVQALALVGEDLYAGTLGSGLSILHGGIWEKLDFGELPGDFITALASDGDGGRLLIGTISFGLLILDIKSGKVSRLSAVHRGFTAANVTVILPDSRGGVWIGTYGDGLYLWDKDEIRHFTRSQGQIGDDWILCACETPKALYFGSLGGGVSVLSKGEGRWGRIGIEDGLASPDVTSVAHIGPYVFFGTLGQGVSRYFEGYAENGNGAKF